MRSHSFASIISPGRSVGSAVMMTIFPDLSISIRAICTPAAVTALTALVTSCCRNVEGPRAILSHPLCDAVAPHLHLQPRSDAMQGSRCNLDLRVARTCILTTEGGWRPFEAREAPHPVLV